MNFGDILKKGEAALAGKDGKIDYASLEKDAQEAYKTFNSTEGSFTQKAQAAYSGYNASHSGAKQEVQQAEQGVENAARKEGQQLENRAEQRS